MFLRSKYQQLILKSLSYSSYAECWYVECAIFIVMLSVVMPNVVMLSVVALSEQILYVFQPNTNIINSWLANLGKHWAKKTNFGQNQTVDFI